LTGCHKDIYITDGSLTAANIFSKLIYNVFKINILLSDSFFSRSTISWQWHELISDCVQYLLCRKSMSHFKFCWWYFLFFCFLSAVTMSETSLHHCVSKIAILRNKDELHLLVFDSIDW